jgi:hypothetical protein
MCGRRHLSSEDRRGWLFAQHYIRYLAERLALPIHKSTPAGKQATFAHALARALESSGGCVRTLRLCEALLRPAALVLKLQPEGHSIARQCALEVCFRWALYAVIYHPYSEFDEGTARCGSAYGGTACSPTS